MLKANSIYLAEGQWNPGAYDDAKYHAEAMTHALDNTHLETIPPEFVAGPGPNSWESLGNPNRPHVPGVVSGSAPQQSPPGDVPAVPQMPLQEPLDPLQPIPNQTPKKPRSSPPREEVDKVYEATELRPEAMHPNGDSVSPVGFTESSRATPKTSSSGKAKMSNSGKATLR